MSTDYLVGLMSGTSLDGVDSVLAEFRGDQMRCLAAHHVPFSADIRSAALALQSPGADELHRSQCLARTLAHCYADAVHGVLAAAGTTAGQITAIGCHGQTVRHQPASGYSLQINQPALLAELCGIPVVADFRSRDIAAGGQGAPLVPAFHAARFGIPERHRTILNLGGIANLTDLPPGHTVRGFDCGPANLLLDAWAQRHLGTPYDAGGQWAASGTPLTDLVKQLLASPFFALPPPKSCGREDFDLAWLERALVGHEAAADVQASLVEVTVHSIVEAIDRWCAGRPHELYACGGGARNTHLLTRLGGRLPGVVVTTTDALGLPVEHVEAAAFAWLAWRTLHGRPGNLPTVTGARGPRILGAIYPA